MIDLVRDTWRAVLVVVVVIVLREVLADRPAPSQPVAAQTPPPTMQMMPLPGPAPQWQPAPPGYGNPGHGNPYPEQRNDRPLRRIGSAIVELGDSLIGAIRR
jgi:hypothetical protein